MVDAQYNGKAHAWVEERLSDYVDNVLPALERAKLERHLSDCTRCQHSLDSLRWSISLVKHAPKPALPRQFTIPVPRQTRQSPVFSLGILRLATALATLVLVSLVGIDLIMQYDGGTRGAAPAAQPAALGAQAVPPTRAALAYASPTTEARVRVQATSVAPTPTPTALPSPTLAPLPTNAPSAPIAPPPPPVAPAATAAPLPSSTAAAPRAFSQPSSATRNAAPGAGATMTLPAYGLGGGAPPGSSPKSADGVSATAAPLPASKAIEPTPTAVPPTATPAPPTPTASATSIVPTPSTQPRAEAANPPTLEPAMTAVGQSESARDLISPLRIAELGTLFVTAFLGALLLLISLRRG